MGEMSDIPDLAIHLPSDELVVSMPQCVPVQRVTYEGVSVFAWVN